MPEMRFRIRWPDGRLEDCFSPSTVLTRHLSPATDYPLAEFHDRARTALIAGDARMRARFGMGCAMAMNQMARIDAGAASFADQPDAIVRVESIDL